MEPLKGAERTRQQLEKLSPEKRAQAEAILDRTRTPEFRAEMAAARETLDREYRETGRISTVGESILGPEGPGLTTFLSGLRRAREAKGLSLADVAERSGIDKAALSRLENGQQSNPTLHTLARYARAIGKRLCWSLEDEPAEQPTG
jgi:DNA-binding XRE family transcriptional regulator